MQRYYAANSGNCQEAMDKLPESLPFLSFLIILDPKMLIVL
jgi:hypothetical protein